jgi:hypothetical protein
MKWFKSWTVIHSHLIFLTHSAQFANFSTPSNIFFLKINEIRLRPTRRNFCKLLVLTIKYIFTHAEIRT